jgi:hypothetical protein
MNDLLSSARGDAASNIAAAMFEGTAEALQAHGDDPQARQILLAAMMFFIDKLAAILERRP